MLYTVNSGGNTNVCRGFKDINVKTWDKYVRACTQTWGKSPELRIEA